MQDKFLLFLMLQKIIQTKYNLDVIGLIQISPRVYKVKTANHFYCVKIVDEKKLEVAYQHLNTLHLNHFIHLILNNENIELIDCQIHSAHLESLGAKMIPKKEYLKILQKQTS